MMCQYCIEHPYLPSRLLTLNAEVGGFGFGEEDGNFVVEANNNNDNTSESDDEEYEDIFAEENEEYCDY